MAAPKTVNVGRFFLKGSSALLRTPSASPLHKVHGSIWLRALATEVSSNAPTPSTAPPVGHAGTEKAQKISQAMKSYLERAKAHDDFMQNEVHEFEIGKRHLANIMGADPDNFTQDDIDQAIEYLLPSGVFAKKARPMLKHPTDVIPKRKAAQFGLDGRPFHSLFYTGTPNYYQLMHNLAIKLNSLKELEVTKQRLDVQPDPQKKLILGGSVWIDKHALEVKLTETLSDEAYEAFVKLFDRLANQPFAYEDHDLIMEYRRILSPMSVLKEIPQPLYDETGRAYQEGTGQRKTATAQVKVWEKGSGKVDINGKDLFRYFPSILDREQILFPLQFTKKLGVVDFEARVELGGNSSQAGAIRLALATALQSLVDRQMVEKMRIAGVLTRDPRVRERKKFGQEGARRKFTWKKR